MATLEQSDVGGVRVLRLAGPLTVGALEHVAPAFAAAVRSGPAAVAVDLSGVDVVATPGIAMLLEAQRAANEVGRVIVLFGMRGVVEDVIRRCRLDVVLTIAPTQEQAIEMALRAAGQAGG
jgi:anti-anti-sigma factor